MHDIAEVAGIAPATVRSYRRVSGITRLPDPDVMLADRPRWRRSSIDAWLTRRRTLHS